MKAEAGPFSKTHPFLTYCSASGEKHSIACNTFLLGWGDFIVHLRADLERFRFALLSGKQLQQDFWLGCTAVTSLEQCHWASAEELHQDVYPTVLYLPWNQKTGLGISMEQASCSVCGQMDNKADSVWNSLTGVLSWANPSKLKSLNGVRKTSREAYIM